MPIQIGQRVDHGFDEPLGLLSDCHRRIEHFLRVLVTVATEAAGGSLTSEHRSALEGALRYFDVAAPKHTADEEMSLFPRLRNSRDPALEEALASLDRLERITTKRRRTTQLSRIWWDGGYETTGSGQQTWRSFATI